MDIPDLRLELRDSLGERRERVAADARQPASIISDIKIETHFEPLAAPRAVAPLAVRLAEALPVPEIGKASAPVIRPAAAEGEIASLPSAGSAPVRVLKIELRPADLGVLHVSMRIISGRLEVTVAATSADTAGWLDGNREALAGALRGNGRDFTDVDIRILLQDPGSTVEALAASALRSADRGAGRSADPRQSGADDRQRTRRTQDDRQADGDPDRDRGIYL